MNEKDELDGNLARALEALDARAARAARNVDAARVAALVLQRLRVGDAEPSWRPVWQTTLVRVAAALVLMAATTVTVVRFASRFPVALPVALQSEEFSAGELDSMMTAVDEARAAGRAGPVTTAVTVDDLNVQELVTLLTALNEPVEKT